MRRIFSIVLIVTLLIPTGAHAQTGDQCNTHVQHELAKEVRKYRAIMFGKKKAEDAPVGDVRYDKDGLAWIKTTRQSTPWINGKESGLTWSNQLMDEQDELNELFKRDNNDKLVARRGIFETKRVLTSALIPYLLQNMRALTCNIERICAQARLSEGHTEEEAVEFDIQTSGCIEFEKQKSYVQCHLGDADSATHSVVKPYCDQVGKQLLQREVALLRLAVEYDAGYRSTLQFAGMFDSFLNEIRWPLTSSIRQAASLIGQLNRIPCFLSSCDASPPPEQQ